LGAILQLRPLCLGIVSIHQTGSHAGILTRFSYHFIRTGRISEEVGGVLARAETDRNRADYDAFSTFRPETAHDLLADVRRFVDAARRLIDDQRR
jgi:hypothetical protein